MLARDLEMAANIGGATIDIAPDTEIVEAIAAPGRRIILLSGEALVEHSIYHMEATLFASESGALEGEILWSVSRSRYLPNDAAGVEQVRGAAAASQLTFSGYKMEGPFVKERYRISLFGAEEAGVFEGASEAYGAWDAHLSGSYQVVTERS